MTFNVNEKIQGLWAVEYSAKQDCFNLDDLCYIMSNNVNACLSSKSNDYQILFIGTQNECDKFLTAIKVAKSSNDDVLSRLFK